MTALVVVSHSDPDSLTHHVVRSVTDAIRTAGDAVETADLAAENFDPRFADGDLDLFRGKGNTPADVRAEQDRIDRADHLVLVFPMYWWSMPALLKGWIDRVFVSGWAYDLTADYGIVKKLDRLTVHLVSLAGDDADSFERHGVYDAFRTQIERGIVEYCGATVGSTTFLHETDTKTPDALAAEVAELATSLAARIADREKALTH
ncbi:NAD(P)H dehydrogenase [Rhodococcus sp. 15-725-2-2b]|jgi:NAD(P)H dehydrogenase (quinone)|uniref:NAD(P)H-dependent oxidoreductase n=1 Tax=unclassified Rhodococcus (in: high G+C Gram-positive bacteria) TaxID=192944 RepID=UPI000B9A361D|nr:MULTISPECIES: NAD(P)H-dependent oxidoreductase [unclassified Rhodococcus (in: high G+C Gram-positive bacteria)]OZC63003.1 NAD(P)H dehydrogenase [Rhodococcus sp. 06-469-3-2]OZD41403.1 NAD(P)H dehydrogenase [Rhodococcus sp. 06-1477-1A]OZE65870.1 NAD(P)H dehydrogenase [Rhodococcus sp. 15-725-2-2b]OZE65978.1 NAD(P)H dehydrogenase [Rhodococcus sp. 15-725-2-2b]